MKKLRPGTGFVIFVLFFGIAFLEAFRTKDWWSVAFWAAMAMIFLLLDNRKNESRES
jgi:hypothetical protein